MAERKVLLVNSPLSLENRTDTEDLLPPLGLAYLAASLEKSGIQCEILDCIWNGESASDAVSTISNHDFVGINIFSVNIEIVRHIIEKCANTKFIVGGGATQHILKIINEFKSSNRITAIGGEADHILPDIIKSDTSEPPHKSLNNLDYYQVSNSSKYYPATIDNLFPHRKKLNNYGFYSNIYNEIETGIVTSRGCLYNCRFCGSSRTANTLSRARIKSSKSLKSEIETILRLNDKIKTIRFLDDLFLHNKKRNSHIISYLAETNLSWRAMTHVDIINNMTEKAISGLKNSGCKELFIGIESGSHNIIKFINKKHTPSLAKKAINTVTKHGINVKCYFIYGFPTETISDYSLTLRLARELAHLTKNNGATFRASAFKYRPYHGTWLYKFLIDKGYSIKFERDINLSAEIGRHQFNFSGDIHDKRTNYIINGFIKRTLEL